MPVFGRASIISTPARAQCRHDPASVKTGWTGDGDIFGAGMRGGVAAGGETMYVSTCVSNDHAVCQTSER